MSTKRKVIIYVTCVLLFYPGAFTHAFEQDNKQLKIHFINVGQGDSILIETPNKKHILIDGGPPKAGKLVVSYLEKRNIQSIDLMIATHPDYDHIGGLPDVMNNFTVDHIIETGKFHLTKAYAAYAATVFAKQIPFTVAKKGDMIDIDALLHMEVLNSSSDNKDNNPSSLALKLTYDEIDVLFLADVEKTQEKNMMKQTDVSAQIIKVAHHGSNTSSSALFLEEVQPEIAILTYSKNNEFGHPAPRVVSQLQSLTSLIYSTAVFGNIVIESDGKDYIVFPEKSPFDALVE